MQSAPKAATSPECNTDRDDDYFVERALAERALERSAGTEEARLAHRQLAESYEAKVKFPQNIIRAETA